MMNMLCWGNKRHRYEREERKLKEKNKAKNILKEYATITVGMFIVSASVYYLMMPNSFVVGSISGLVMVLANFIPLKVSTMTMILNVAVTPDVPTLTDDMFINMLCHILVISIGQAILFNVNASSGGLDVVAKVLNKYLHFEIGKSLTIAGFVTAATSILFYDRKTLVVSLLGTYLYGIVLDNFIDGFSIRKRVCILSKKYPEIQQFVVHELHRGATLYPAVGGLGNQEQTEVVTILEKSEYAKLLAFIHETDQSAFVTVSTVSEVIGEWNKHKKNRLRKAE